MILLYDPDLQLIGPIEHAIRVSYELRLNELSTATLILPAGDEMAQKIVVPASYARIYDGNRDLGFYRFSAVPTDDHATLGTITYSLQSAECTLLDDILPGWHELGGTGLGTRWVLEYILARQTTARWTLGQCDFTDYYQYNFEDVSLLESLMSLGEVLLDDYRFRFDTTGDTWTLDLIRLPAEAASSLTYGRNTTRIRRSIDGSVVTRLYGRGYGEGDNQLTIASVNGGKDYIDADAATIAKWGIRTGVHVDTRQTDPATLKAHMERILDAGKHPAISYEADAVDLSLLTGERWDDVQLGDKVLILDELLGEPVSVRVTCVSKEDIDGDPGSVTYTLDNSIADTAEELNEILDKIGVQELYSQGATNMYSMQLSDNADETHPLTMRFYVPGNVLRINSCLIYWQIERFRTYATLAKSGGGSSRTSQEGGGATVSIPQVTTSAGVVYSSEPMDTEGSASGYTGGPKDYAGNVKTSTSSAGDHNHNMTHVHAVAGHDHTFTGEAVTYSIAHNHSLAGTGATATGGIYSGNSSIRVTPTGTVGDSGTLWTTGAYDSAGGSGKQATGNNGSHTHVYDHVHNMPHVHNIEHQHIIPAMTFELTPHSHTYTIPAHTHELEYGVYEGTRASGIGIVVDGETVPESDIGEAKELDVAKYMRKNDDGKVTRGTWHEVEFVPDALTRITANLFFQVFIQSRGRGITDGVCDLSAHRFAGGKPADALHAAAPGGRQPGACLGGQHIRGRRACRPDGVQRGVLYHARGRRDGVAERAGEREQGDMQAGQRLLCGAG